MCPDVMEKMAAQIDYSKILRSTDFSHSESISKAILSSVEREYQKADSGSVRESFFSEKRDYWLKQAQIDQALK